MNEKLILVVDDEPQLANTLVAILRLSGYTAEAVNDCAAALALVREKEPTLVISDVIMQGESGVSLAMRIHEMNPEIHIILMSGNTETSEIIEDAYARGYGFELLAKPVPPREMLERVAQIFRAEDGRALAQAAS